VAGRVPAVHSTRRRRRRSRKLLAVAVLVAIVMGGGGAAVGYITLKPRVDQLQSRLAADLQAGQRELEAGKASLTQAGTKHDASLVAEAIAHFVAAKKQFLAAGQLADTSRLLHDLEEVPGVGSLAHSRHSAVDGIAEMGAALSDAGQDLSNLYAQLTKPTIAGQPARNVLTVLDQAQPSVVKIRGELQRAQKGASQVDVAVVPAGQQATFIKASGTIALALAGLDEFDRLVPVLHEALGGNGARTYLIEQVNPAELRAGGGFIGTYSLVRADQGALTLIQSGSAADLANPRPLPGQPGFIPQPGPYREVIPDISWSFLDSNLFPDFASNAKAGLGFVQPRLGTRVDAVIAIDYYTVAKMLELTGPLAVPGFALTVDASNFVSRIIADDIAAAAGDIAAIFAHKAILTAIAGPLMQRVTALPPDRWPALVASLNGLVAERHLQAYFTSDLVEKELDRVGWSGVVNPTGARNYMMEVESNYYGDKANYFVTRHYTVVLTRSGGTLHHQVTIDLVNKEPCGIEERTSYRVNVRLYVGESASSLSDNLRPVQFPNPSPPAGTGLLDGWLPDIRCGGERGQAVFKYDTPWRTDRSGLNQIYWQKQPGTVTDKIDLTWNDGSGHNFKVNGDLGQDRVIILTPKGVTLAAGHAAPVQLPSLSLG
jgi:hypothetical protein